VFIIPGFPSAEPRPPQPRLLSGQRSPGTTCLKTSKDNVGCRHKLQNIFLVFCCCSCQRNSQTDFSRGILNSVGWLFQCELWLVLMNYTTALSAEHCGDGIEWLLATLPSCLQENPPISFRQWSSNIHCDVAVCKPAGHDYVSAPSIWNRNSCKVAVSTPANGYRRDEWPKSRIKLYLATRYSSF
jgi:hypothetical protein